MSEKKTGFDPISNQDTEILILGTFPGARSLEVGEYYAHQRNRFWTVIAEIANGNLPRNYEEKIELLLKHKIGIWDVLHKVKREGSSDTKIMEGEPNLLDDFISKHKNLRIIGFNGKKAEKLFNRHFKKQNHVNYVLLLSTSPANARYSLEEINNNWREKLIRIEVITKYSGQSA